MKIAAIYCQLKAVFYCGIWRNHTRNADKIAEFLKISPRTWRTRRGDLEAHGLLTFSGSKMVLCSWYDFGIWAYNNDLSETENLNFCRFNLDSDLKKIFDTKYSFATLFRLVAIQKNLNKQAYQVREKIIQTSIDISFDDLKGLTPSEIAQEVKQRFADIGYHKKLRKKQLKFLFSDPKREQQTMDKYAAKFQKNWRETIHPEINTTVTLSNEGLAALFGSSAKSTGYYWQNQLEKIGLLSVQRFAAVRVTPKRPIVNKRWFNRGDAMRREHELQTRYNKQVEACKNLMFQAKRDHQAKGACVFELDYYHERGRNTLMFRKPPNVLKPLALNF